MPNSTSRDEMGRAKVNDLQGFFIAKYGGEDSVSYQKARQNFIQSMAGYSVACYILQIKDRHNGNIMIDGEGHIVHIGAYTHPPSTREHPTLNTRHADFGFLFDIDKLISLTPMIEARPHAPAFLYAPAASSSSLARSSSTTRWLS